MKAWRHGGVQVCMATRRHGGVEGWRTRMYGCPEGMNAWRHRGVSVWSDGGIEVWRRGNVQVRRSRGM